MSAYVLARPVWRRFRPRWLGRAAAHVRAGGLAAITHPDDHVDVLLGVDGEGRVTELGRWALLAIDHKGFRRVKDGAARGLAEARIRRAYEGSVLDWCARDSVHPGATRTIELDCLACGACCHDATVLLDDDDLGRWRAAGRPELAGRDYVRRLGDGKVLLRFADGRCQHLLADRRCAIYPLRPDNCRVFVVGSEACLAAREDTLGLRDGANAG